MGFDDRYLRTTEILDFQNDRIQALVANRGWRDLTEPARIGAAYDFVRNEILFGYNTADELQASRVLSDGYGQCNTKGTLLIALLRALGIPCRLHGFTIHKELQRGVVPELAYAMAPDEILHSWVEVFFEGEWVNLEGFILDEGFLARLQEAFPETETLCGYGAGTDCLQDPAVNWTGRDTYIQRTGIRQDFGTFLAPDDFYEQYRQSFGPLQRFLYRTVIRHWMNMRVRKIRNGRLKPQNRRLHAHPAERAGHAT